MPTVAKPTPGHSVMARLSRNGVETRMIIRAVAAVTLALVSVAVAHPAVADDAQAISGTNPACEQGVEYEPQVAVNPMDPDNIVAVWIEGIGQGLVAGVTKDGGQSWTQVLVPVSGCIGPGLREDPRLAFGGDGTLYLASLCLASCSEDVLDPDPQHPKGTDLVVVHRSTDGGLTWDSLGKPPKVVAGNDPEGCADVCQNGEVSITAHPTKAGYAYLTWTRHNSTWPWLSYLSRTTDGGQSWSKPAIFYTPPRTDDTHMSDASALLHDIRVLPDGSLLDVFVQYQDREVKGIGYAHQMAMRSTNDGLTWSSPTLIGFVRDIKAKDPELPNLAAQGAVKPAFDAAPDGTAYVAWQEIESTTLSSIRISKSNNKTRTKWVELTPVKPVSDHQAFQPMLAVGSDGTIGVTYYDFRNDQPGDDELTTDVWFSHSHDGGVTWQETHLAGPFNLRAAAIDPTLCCFLLGEVAGLAATPDGFAATFVQAGDAAPEPPQDVFFARVVTP